MIRFATIVASAALIVTAANAEVEIITVPATCGTYQAVMDVLSVRMPNPRAIARGGDSRGEDVVLLIADANYWALVARMSQGNVCVVASGYNWTQIEPRVVESF